MTINPGGRKKLRALAAPDDDQLHRVESAIARIEGRPPSEQLKIASLLTALLNERAVLRRYSARGGRAREQNAVGARALHASIEA